MRDKKYTSEIIISQQALQFNIDFLRKEMGKEVLISSVVKGNAYGHGIETFVPMAEDCGIKHFSVFSIQEAIRVKKVLKNNIPIMIMGYTSDSQLEWVIENNVEFFVSDLEKLKISIEVSKRLEKKALIHIELETGMNRTGIAEATLSELVFPMLDSNREYYILKGICTHFAGAESISNHIRVQQQKNLFLKLKTMFEQKGYNPEYIHASCSAAALRMKKMRFNMVRIGILQFGFWPSQEVKMEYLIRKKLKHFNLKRLITWKSHIMAIKNVKMGDFIGYGNAYQASENMTIGVVPVGYSDGYSRMLSNSGTVLIGGIRAGILGSINMNSLIIDLRYVENPHLGDTVTLIGSDGESEISVASFSELSNQLNYELLARLPLDIDRIPSN